MHSCKCTIQSIFVRQPTFHQLHNVTSHIQDNMTTKFKTKPNNEYALDQKNYLEQLAEY